MRSITTLLTLPAAQGLFQRAILQSGAVGPARSSAEATTTAHTVLEILDLSPATLSRINEIPADRLVEAASGLPDWRGTRGTGETIHFAPVIVGVVLSQPPLRAIAHGVATSP